MPSSTAYFHFIAPASSHATHDQRAPETRVPPYTRTTTGHQRQNDVKRASFIRSMVLRAHCHPYRRIEVNSRWSYSVKSKSRWRSESEPCTFAATATHAPTHAPHATSRGYETAVAAYQRRTVLASTFSARSKFTYDMYEHLGRSIVVRMPYSVAIYRFHVT